MSGKQQSDDHDQPRSPSHTEDEEKDFQLALKLSAKLNGDHSGSSEAAAAAGKGQAVLDAYLEAIFETCVNDAAKKQPRDKKETEAIDHASSPHRDGAALTHALTHQTPVESTSATIVQTETSAGQTFQSPMHFQDYVKARECTHCGSKFLQCGSDAKELFREWVEGSGELSSFRRCKACGLSSCMACASTSSSERSSVTIGNQSVSWCCDDGRVLLIWLLLCGLDLAYCETKDINMKEVEAAKKQKAQEMQEMREMQRKVRLPPEVESKGKGKATVEQVAQHSGIGFSGDIHSGFTSPGFGEFTENLDHESIVVLLKHVKMKSAYDASRRGRGASESKSRILKARQALDRLGTTVLSLLPYLFPSPERVHSFDMDPPAILIDMLLESRVLDYCTDLLRNDSLDDAVSRKGAYKALLGFVEAIGMHYTTASLAVFSGRIQQLDQCNLFAQTYYDVQPCSSSTAPSIADSLHELSRLSDLLLKNAEHPETSCRAGSDPELLCLCRRISQCWKSVSAQNWTPDAEASNDSAPSTCSEEVAAISDVSDEEICVSHAFAKKAEAQSYSGLGRLKRLVSEIKILKSSLPPNVFVRHGESRLDMMKWVIIGPGDTPYEHGMFEFDVYCPADYPSQPPLVSFKGSAGRATKINPNLYADGKVCLSLLGTWAGEPWRPGESTLLQVLVSLQAMVFCEQPWFNEPGREYGYSWDSVKETSEAYNRRVRESTVRLALLGWLDEVPRMWKEVVEQHFQSRADTILRTVMQWSEASRPHLVFQNPERASRLPRAFAERLETGYGDLLPKLHQGLQRFGATVGLPEVREVPRAPGEDAGPQSKKVRIEGSQREASEVPVAPPAPAPPVSNYGRVGNHFSSNVWGTLNREDLSELYAPVQTRRGGYRGRGTHDGSYSSRGRGQMPSSSPGHTPSALSAPPIAPVCAFERGRGRVVSWLRHGGSLPGPVHPASSFHMYDAAGRGFGGEEEGGRGGGGGRGGRGGRGGSGSSQT